MIVAAVLIGLLALFRFVDVPQKLGDTLKFVDSLGALGPVLFIVIYGLAAVLLIPGSVLTLGAGGLFGVTRGFLYVSVASVLGATAAFLIGRYFARDWVANKIQDNPVFLAIDRAVVAEGSKIVILTRLSPVFPFTLLNYAFGLTQVRLRDYVIASWIGMMPGTLVFVYLGSLTRVGTKQRSPAEWALYGIGLLATIAVTVVLTRIARRAIAKRAAKPS